MTSHRTGVRSLAFAAVTFASMLGGAAAARGGELPSFSPPAIVQWE